MKTIYPIQLKELKQRDRSQPLYILHNGEGVIKHPFPNVQGLGKMYSEYLKTADGKKEHVLSFDPGFDWIKCKRGVFNVCRLNDTEREDFETSVDEALEGK